MAKRNMARRKRFFIDAGHNSIVDRKMAYFLLNKQTLPYTEQCGEPYK
jgi:hypothetical protein